MAAGGDDAGRLGSGLDDVFVDGKVFDAAPGNGAATGFDTPRAVEEQYPVALMGQLLGGRGPGWATPTTATS